MVRKEDEWECWDCSTSDVYANVQVVISAVEYLGAAARGGHLSKESVVDCMDFVRSLMSGIERVVFYAMMDECTGTELGEECVSRGECSVVC